VLEGLSQSLAQEVAGFGIKVTLIEPGGYSADWGGSSARHATALPAYDDVREQAANRPSKRGTAGDPVATRDAVLTLVDAVDPPLRVFFGEAPLAIATASRPGTSGSRCRSPRTASGWSAVSARLAAEQLTEGA